MYPTPSAALFHVGFGGLMMFASQTAYQPSHLLRTITDIFTDDYLVREIVHAKPRQHKKVPPLRAFPKQAQ